MENDVGVHRAFHTYEKEVSLAGVLFKLRVTRGPKETTVSARAVKIIDNKDLQLQNELFMGHQILL